MNLELFVQYGAVGLFLAFLGTICILARLIAPIVQKALDIASNHLGDLTQIIADLGEHVRALKESVDALRGDIREWRK